MIHTSPQAPVVINSKAQSERPELTADRQQHVNSKSALFQLCSCSDLRFYRPFPFDFTRELVSRTTLTWLGSQVRSLSWPPFLKGSVGISAPAWRRSRGVLRAFTALTDFKKQTARPAILTIGSSGRLRESTPQERSELLSRNHWESFAASPKCLTRVFPSAPRFHHSAAPGTRLPPLRGLPRRSQCISRSAVRSF